MGAAGRPERPSERKREANRANARRPRPSARKVPEKAAELLKRVHAELRALLKHKDPEVRLRAAAQIMDRAGAPRRSEQTVAQFTDFKPKLYQLGRPEDFKPPAPASNDDRHEPGAEGNDVAASDVTEQET